MGTLRLGSAAGSTTFEQPKADQAFQSILKGISGRGDSSRKPASGPSTRVDQGEIDVPGKGRLQIKYDTRTGVYSAHGGNAKAQYALEGATTLQDAKAAARSLIENGGVSRQNLLPSASNPPATSSAPSTQLAASANPFAAIVANAAASKDGEFAGVPGKGQLLVARDAGTGLFVAHNRNGGQYVLAAATTLDDAKAAARRIIEGGGVSPANLYPLNAAGKLAPAAKVETIASSKVVPGPTQALSASPFSGTIANATAPKNGQFAGVPGKGQLLVAQDPATGLFVAHNRKGGQYVLPAATSMDDAKAAARRIIEGGGVSQANLYPLAASEKAASSFKTSVTVSQNRTVGTTQASAKHAWLKEQGGTTTLNETSVSVKTAGLTTDNSLNASASFDPKKAATSDVWSGLAGFLGVKKAEASVGFTVGRRDSNVAEFKATRGRAPDFKTYDETTKLGMRASGSLEMNVLGQPVKLAVEPVAIKVAERNDGRGQYTEIATTAGGSTSMNSVASAAAEKAGSPASPRGTLASAKADVGSFVTTTQQALATQLDPAAVSRTGVIDGARVAGASIAGLTTTGIKVAAQTPLAVVQTALQTGAAIADGTKAAADATLRAGFEAVGLKDSAASMGQKTPGVVEAGDILRAGANAAGAANGAVGAIVDGTVGATADAIRLTANGDDRRNMSPEELTKAGYGSLGRLQKNVNAASTQLRDNPATRAPSLPTSWGEVRRRLTPQ